MSLLASASPWNNDDSGTRKRTPTMARKTAKKLPSTNQEEHAPYVEEGTRFQETTVYDIDETQQIQKDRNTRVNDILNKITSVNVDNDGKALANFVPLDKPQAGVRHDSGTIPPPLPNNLITPNMGRSNWSANNLNASNLSNYKTSYEPPSKNTSYYSRM